MTLSVFTLSQSVSYYDFRVYAYQVTQKCFCITCRF